MLLLRIKCGHFTLTFHSREYNDEKKQNDTHEKKIYIVADAATLILSTFFLVFLSTRLLPLLFV